MNESDLTALLSIAADSTTRDVLAMLRLKQACQGPDYGDPEILEWNGYAQKRRQQAAARVYANA